MRLLEVVNLQIAQVFSSTEKRWAVSVTLLLSLVIITPLCGLLFQCGCDWPWLGLDAHCNFYKSYEEHHCPWCVSMVSGVLSAGLAIVSGVYTAIVSVETLISPIKRHEVVVRTLVGFGIFFLVAILTASVAAIWQSYPLGLGFFYGGL